ncbi:MAG: hypothetical protein LC808_31985, partial [Actinobacteria bacterium]|nr:hypothetical protein [Actinomycetota bacterium]
MPTAARVNHQHRRYHPSHPSGRSEAEPLWVAGVSRVSLTRLGTSVRDNDHVTLGLAPRQADLLCSTATFCEERVAPESIYGVLHRECFTLFPDEMFADLFTEVGRRSVPPMIVAVVMVLQRIEGCSDREAVDRFAFDV